MKSLLILAIGLMSASAFADYMTGDKIHFQADSTWVNSYYSKSLCQDGENYYATISVCVEYRESSDGDRECARRGTKNAVQPLMSTRKKCAVRDWTDDDNDCEQYETVEYYQSPVRTVKFFEAEDDSSGRLVRTETYTIPACH